MDIVFAPLVDNSFYQHHSGTGSAVLPALRSFGREVVGTQTYDGYSFVELPELESSGTAAIHLSGDGIAVLPALFSFATSREGGYSINFLPELTSYGRDASTLVPQDGFGSMLMPSLESSATGYAGVWGVGIADLPVLESYAFEAAGAYGIGFLPALTSAAYDTQPTPENYGILVQSAGIMYSSYGFNLAPIYESMAASLTVGATNSPNIIERPTLTDTMSASVAMQLYIVESDRLDEGINLVLSALAASSGSMTDSVTTAVTKLEELIETLVLSGIATSSTAALAIIAEALLLNDLVRSGWSVAALSTAEATAFITERVRFIAAALSTASMAMTATPMLGMTALLDDTLDAADVLGTSAKLFAAIAEGLAMAMVLRFGDAEYSVWALSTNKRLRDDAPIAGVVEYRNMVFNSATKFNGRYYFGNDNGLFELGGSTDNGAEIESWVRSAINNLSTGLVKRMPTMYLGYKSSGAMVLKVVHTSEKGTKTEDWYSMVPRTAMATRENRIKVGRGLSSVYWAWELKNVDGADFALDVVELMLLLLERRGK